MTLEDRVVLITGASSGIGRACAVACAAEGARLILVARRAVQLEQLARDLRDKHATASHCIPLDVRDKDAVQQELSNLQSPWSAVDVLINAAGLSRGLDPIQSGVLSDWDEMLDTNVKGLLWVTRAVLPGMLERDRGHVVNLGSIAGREVYGKGAVYCASKYAVRALTQGLRLDVHGTSLRVTTIDPGLVQTDFSLVRFHGDRDRASKVYENTRPLSPHDVADAVVFALTRPAHVTVAELVLLASDQATATTIHRRS